MSNYSYVSRFLGGLQADVMFKELWEQLPWERRPDAPRRECWMNDFNRPYTYGRGKGTRTYNANPWNEHILNVRAMLNDKLHCDFEGCFVNGYEDSTDWLGWHADDDPLIDHSRPIAVVSLGQSRAIQTKVKKGYMGSENKPETFVLDSGSLFVMPEGSQATHLHRIPKVGHAVTPRISLTFRGLLNVDHQ